MRWCANEIGAVDATALAPVLRGERLMMLGRSRSLSGFVAAKLQADSYQSVVGLTAPTAGFGKRASEDGARELSED
jgi:hypothetical protein